ncbi:OSJNBb0028M18.1-like protein [Zea mays]|uniref:OSJNBb0028M18.1-like protein n=1 Tax=Zea mays TaxID=4577 RepID=A0A1D6IWS2_MAIZE|nr:OSJNBb0028M18.1-like protein [Zea mays]
MSRLQACCDDLNTQRSHLHDEKNSVVKSLNVEKDEVAKLRLKIEELENYNGEKDGDIRKLKAALDEKKGKIDTLGKEIELLQLVVAEDQKKGGIWTCLYAATTTMVAAISFIYATSALGLEEKHGDEDASKSQTSNSDRIGFFIPVMSFMGHNGEEGINSTPTKGHISEVDPSEVSGTTSPKLPSNSEEVHVAEEKLDSSTETPASKVGDAESSEVSQSTGHPSTVEDIQVHQVSKHPGPSDEVEPNQLRGSVGDLPEGSASSATTKIHQSGDTETRESIHTRMGLEDTSDRNILQAQLAESALEPAEPEESLAIEENLLIQRHHLDFYSPINVIFEAYAAKFDSSSGSFAQRNSKLLKETVNMQPEQADYYVVRNHIVVLWCSSPCTNADEYHAIVVAADFGDIVFNQFLDKVCRLRQVVVDVAPHGVEVTLGMALAAFRAARGVAAKHEAKLFLDWHLENLVYAIAASLTDLSMALWGSV